MWLASFIPINMILYEWKIKVATAGAFMHLHKTHLNCERILYCSNKIRNRLPAILSLTMVFVRMINIDRNTASHSFNFHATRSKWLNGGKIRVWMCCFGWTWISWLVTITRFSIRLKILLALNQESFLGTEIGSTVPISSLVLIFVPIQAFANVNDTISYFLFTFRVILFRLDFQNKFSSLE